MIGLPKVLMVDDDPDHLKIYGWILERGGLQPIPCQVRRRCLELPDEADVDLIVLDYALHCGATPEEVAGQLRNVFPNAPIVLLSEVQELPEDIEPYVKAFVRKGNPEKLVAIVKNLLGVEDDERDRALSDSENGPWRTIQQRSGRSAS